MSPSVSFLKRCTPLQNWRLFVVILVPFLLSPLLFIQDDDVVVTKGGEVLPSTKFPCAFVIIMMAIYWMIEALPLAITAMLPIIWFPLLGINSTAAVTQNYMRETCMLFLGGIIIALAVEYSNLHKRVALKVMCAIGGSPFRLMIGIMLTTMGLSMWMSNTASTAMMVPIVLAVLEELYSGEDESSIGSSRSSQLATSNSHCASVNVESLESENRSDDSVPANCTTVLDSAKHRLMVEKMYLFAIAYSSNIGGTGVLTGSGTNFFIYELMQNENIGQDGKYTELTYATWMLFAIPSMLLNVLIAWAYLALILIGLPNSIAFWRKKPVTKFGGNERNHTKVSNMLKQKYLDLGPVTFHEVAVSVIFFICVMLWVFRDPKFVKGWAEYLPSVKIGDATAALSAVLLMFTIPRSLSCFWRGPTNTLLDWKYIQDNLPWSILLLLGAGFALSEAADISGLSKWIGSQFEVIATLHPPVILLLVMIITAFITEVASNTTTANILIPILLSLSKNLNLHPLYLTLPTAITCSYAFMLPVATPPNAIVFGASRGRMKIMDMIRTGIFLNFSCVTVLFLVNITFGNLIFNYSNYVYINSTGLLVSLFIVLTLWYSHSTKYIKDQDFLK